MGTCSLRAQDHLVIYFNKGPSDLLLTDSQASPQEQRYWKQQVQRCPDQVLKEGIALALQIVNTMPMMPKVTIPSRMITSKANISRIRRCKGIFQLKARYVTKSTSNRMNATVRPSKLIKRRFLICTAAA